VLDFHHGIGRNHPRVYETPISRRRVRPALPPSPARPASPDGPTPGAEDTPPVGSKQVETALRPSPREFSSGPLWVWNDLLTEAEIRDTLRDLAART